MKLNWTHFNPIETYLREVHRIKKDTDYSVCIKYGECVVHCQSVYQRAIQEAFNEYKVPVHIFTFKWGSDKGDDEEFIEITKAAQKQRPYGIPELIEACNIRTTEVHRLKYLLDAQTSEIALIIDAAKKVVRVHGNDQPKQLDDAILLLRHALDNAHPQQSQHWQPAEHDTRLAECQKDKDLWRQKAIELGLELSEVKK